MSWFSFSNKREGSIVAILDIGSSSVGGALIQYHHFDKKKELCPSMLHSIRREISFEEQLDFKQFSSKIFSTTKAVIDELVASGHGVPTRYVCFLASPLYVSQTKTLTYSAEKPFIVTEKVVSEISKQEEAKFLEQHKELYAGLLDDETYVLENKLMQVRLNGYETAKPFGKECTKVEISQYLSVTSRGVVKKLHDLCAAAGHHSAIQFHSYNFAAFSTFRDLLGTRPDAMTIDVSGELTDLIVMTKGVLLENISFPYGKKNMLRDISKELGTVPLEAESLLKLQVAGQLADGKQQEVTRALLKVRGTWLNFFKQGLREIAVHTLIPELMFIVSDGESSRLFLSWLTTDTLTEFTLSSKPFQIEFLESHLLEGFCEPPAGGHRDPVLMVEAIFCDKIL